VVQAHVRRGDAPASLPRPPVNPMPFRQRLAAVKQFSTGTERLRDAGGPVTSFRLGPRWLMPPMVLVTSPAAIRDVLSVKDSSVDKTTPVFTEMRRILGANLTVLPFERWKPRRRTLQPVFTKQRVNEFGGHMAQAAQAVYERWGQGAEVNLDAECRELTLRALGRSVLGLDLEQHTGELAEPLRVALTYAIRRATRPLRAPAWLPTPARRRARAASAQLHALTQEILDDCRADPSRVAPLVRALLAAKDPETGAGLSDREICDELIIFVFAGHDTTATTLTHALWSLGNNPDIQDRVVAEVAALPDRPLTPDDISHLGYTTMVVRETLRLCPPTPTGTRLAHRDVEVDGYLVPKGTMLIVGRMAVQRDPSLWDDPLRFDPERFSPDEFKAMDRWQYLPFGGGPRACIGNHFAMLMVTLALATIVRHAEIKSLDDDFPLTLHFTMIAAAPIRAKVTPRRQW
jgi:cytochrome P450